MPTFGDIGAFKFDDAAKDIPETLLDCVDKISAIDVLIKVLQQKFKRNAKYQDLIYFLDGRTGSGKSTMMITSLFKHFLQKEGASILCVEPRTTLAAGNAVDICRYDENLELGKNVSILTGNEKVRLTTNGITYCTSAILNLMLLDAIENNHHKSFINKYRIIVIDEVHTLGEPEIELLLTIKLFLSQLADSFHIPCVFIFTSATININSLVDYYFDIEQREDIFSDALMIGHVLGSQNFPVERRFMKSEDVNLKALYKSLVEEAWQSKSTIKSPNGMIPARDILIFCHTLRIIEKVVGILKDALSELDYPTFNLCTGMYRSELENWRNKHKNKQRINIINFASGIKSYAPQLLASPIENNHEVNLNEMKIIVSTPVIESGKTISTLYMCIDNGFHLKPVYKPLAVASNQVDNTDTPISFISTLPVDKFMITQRFGRVGRESPGVFVHCYTEEIYNNLRYPIEDFKNILSVFDFLTSMAKPYDVIDYINMNKFVQCFGVDTSISTNTIALLNRQVSASNMKFNFSELPDELSNNVWIQAAQYLYLLHGYSLLDSLMLASVNRKTLSNSFIQPKNIVQNIKITIDQIKSEVNVDESLRTAVKDAYNVYKFIRYNDNAIHKGFPFYVKFKLLSRVKPNERTTENSKRPH
jgi:hypothetical protein